MLTHNQITLQEVETFSKAGLNCCVVNACGSGKTAIMSEFIKNHPKSTFTVLTKQKNAKNYYCNKNTIFEGANVCIRTYSKMYRDFVDMSLDDYNTDYILLDEAHYVGASNWRRAFETIISTYHPICIGLTATPQRYEDQGTENTIIKEFFDDNVAGNYSAKDLQRMGVFIEPEYVLSIYNLNAIINDKMDRILDSDLSDKNKKNLLNKLNNVVTTWETHSKPELIFAEYLPKFMYKDKCNRILVYVANVNELPKKSADINRIISNLFKDKTIKSYEYTYKTNEKPLKEFLEEDETYIKIIYSIDKVMETVHIDDLNIAIMLRPSVSNRIITQQFGRINSINNKNKALIIDMVDNLTNLKEANQYMSSTITQQIGVENKSKVNIQIPHITGYYRVFDLIENSLKASKYFTYQNVTASLKDLCLIFLRNYHTVKDYIDKGSTINEAMELTPLKNFNMTSQVLYDDIEDYDFSMSEKEKDYAVANMSIVEHLAKKYHIDDDAKQNLYVYYCYKINKYMQKVKAPHELRQMVSSTTRSYCIRLLRNKYIRSIMYCSYDEAVDKIDTDNEDLPVRQNSLIKNNTISLSEVSVEHEELIAEIQKRTTPKEFNIICLYFGLIDGHEYTLEEIGRNYDVSRERIRQLLEKGLKKIRTSSFVKEYDGILEAYEQ